MNLDCLQVPRKREMSANRGFTSRIADTTLVIGILEALDDGQTPVPPPPGDEQMIQWTRSIRPRVLCILSLIAAVTGTSPLFADIVTVPNDLNPGDEYRLAFVTDDTINNPTPWISYHNNFVSTQANQSTALADLGTTWHAIGSTPYANAHNNTGTTPPGGVPIYRLDGSRVADNYDDLWDASIDNPISITQFGATVAVDVWTGSRRWGNAYTNYTLDGDGVAIIGQSQRQDLGWIEATSRLYGNWYSMYAMSGVLTSTVPEPGGLSLALSGLLAIAVVFYRRRRAGLQGGRC